MSYCKFWIYRVGINTECVNSKFTMTQTLSTFEKSLYIREKCQQDDSSLIAVKTPINDVFYDISGWWVLK